MKTCSAELVRDFFCSFLNFQANGFFIQGEQFSIFHKHFAVNHDCSDIRPFGAINQMGRNRKARIKMRPGKIDGDQIRFIAGREFPDIVKPADPAPVCGQSRTS